MDGRGLSRGGAITLDTSPAAVPVANPLASHDARLTSQVQLFPNPARTSFTLLLSAQMGHTPVAAKILNSLGQLVSERSAGPAAAGTSTQFEVSGLLYALRLTSADGQVVKRVVIE